VVKIITPCEIATLGKSRRSWNHRPSLIQSISLDHLAVRTVTTSRHVGATDADLDLNLRQPSRPHQSRATQTNYNRGLTCSYESWADLEAKISELTTQLAISQL